MGFVSSLPHNLQFPVKFDPGLAGFPSPSSLQLPPLLASSSPLTPTLPPLPIPRVWGYRRPCLRLQCPRWSAKQEGFCTQEGKENISSQPSDATNNGDNATHNLQSSIGTSTATTQLENDKLHPFRIVALWVCAAVAFGVGVGINEGVSKATEFFAGYLLEQSLSVDNLFVFVLIFRYFKVPVTHQSRVLTYGIAGAIIFRASMILLGAATLQRFEAVNLLLASILLYSSFKLFTGEEEETDLSNNFVVKTCQKFIPLTSAYDGDRFFQIQEGQWRATPLFLTLVVIEFSDIAFAVDSIPAVFGVTRDPIIVFSSNFFAILGLRSLYTIINEGMSELEYLQPSIGVILGFIGFKMILDFFGVHVPTEASLGFVAVSLGSGVLLSLVKKSE